MGQKIHPTGFRLSVTHDWTSRWYANTKAFPQMLREDIEVRDYLKKKLAHASVGRVIIERPAKNARVTVFSARPGVVIGKKGEDIEQLRTALQRKMGVPVHVNIEEIRKPETDAQLIADSIAQQLEKRIMFRRAMKRAMQNAMRLGAQGIKIMSSGRLNGAEIARREWYREGRVPLHTLRANIDYGTSEAKTTYGVIGIKVWVYKGEMTAKHEQAAAMPDQSEDLARRPRRPAASRGEGEGAGKPTAKRAARRPAAARLPDGMDKPEAVVAAAASALVPAHAAPGADAAAKGPVRRVRKATVATPADAAGKEGKE